MYESLKNCINSLKDQTYRDYEVIIIDDGSKDNTKSIFDSMNDRRFRYFKQENKGPATARNLGISKAKGKIIAFTDADCITHKDWLKFIYLSFKNNDIECVKGRTEVANSDSSFANSVRNHIYSFSWYATNNIAYSKKVLEKLNYFDGSSFPIAGSEDGDLAWRFKLKGYSRIYCPEMVVFHIYEENMKEYERNCYRYGVGMSYFFKKHLKPNPLLAFGQVAYQIPPLFYYPFLGRKGYLKMIQSFHVLKGFLYTLLNKHISFKK